MLLRLRFFYLLTRSTSSWPDFHLDQSDFRQALEQSVHLAWLKGFERFTVSTRKSTVSSVGETKPPLCARNARNSLLLPEVHFIHIIRDGRDVAVSLRKTWFAPSQDIAALARYWMRIVTTARAEAAIQHLP